MITLFGALGGLDRRRVLEQNRIVLVGLATDEAVEVVEAQSLRPTVEGTGDAALPVGRVVVLAEPRCGVTVVLQDRPDGGRTAGNHVVVDGVGRSTFSAESNPRGVVVV